MAASEQIIKNGQNGEDEVAMAERLAERYRMNFIQLEKFPVDYSLVQSLPGDLMLRNKFVPLRRANGRMVIAVADTAALRVARDGGACAEGRRLGARPARGDRGLSRRGAQRDRAGR